MAAYCSGWLQVTCGLTAYTPGSALGPTLSNEYGRTIPLMTSDSVNTWDSEQLCCLHGAAVFTS